MRLLLLTDWEYPCDHPILTGVYSKLLPSRGHEVVWTMRAGNRNLTEPVTEEWNGNTVYVLPDEQYNPVRVFRTSMTNALSTHPVYDIVQQDGPFDAIQVRNDLAMGLAAASIAEDSGVPFVHRLSHTKAETLCYLARHRHTSSPVRDYVKGKIGKRLRKRLCSQADGIFSISDAMTEYLLSGGYQQPIVSVPTGADSTLDPDSIDPTDFYETYQLNVSDDVVLYVGTMRPVRRLETVVDAFAELNPDPGTTFVMVGGRNQDNVDRLREYADERGVGDSVLFTGWIQDDYLVNQAIVAADVGLSTIPPEIISYRTSSPLKTHEYLNLRTPVVGTAIPDQEMVITESQSGEIVDFDPASIAAGIQSVMDSSEKRERMGRRGRTYVSEHRSYDALATRIITAYQEHILS